MIQIKVDKFQGPLDLLLKLIEKEELDITEISLAKIADQYIEYIRQSAVIGAEEMADFLVVAARLLLIKSKALLPYLYPEEEEEIEELEQQLKMYREFLKAAKTMAGLISQRKFMYCRDLTAGGGKTALANLYQALGQTAGGQESAGFFAPPKKLSAGELEQIFKTIISGLKPVEKLEQDRLEHKINIEEKIMLIQQLLLKRIKLNFNKVLTGAKSKTEMIVSFLAMLELIKQREIAVIQSDLFGDIEINKA